MNETLSDITQYLFAFENQILRIIAESYIMAALCFLVVAIGFITGLCLLNSPTDPMPATHGPGRSMCAKPSSHGSELPF